MTDLVAVVQGHSDLAAELVDRVRSFESEIAHAVERGAELASYELAALRDQFSLLQSEVSRSIAAVGVLHHRGQIREAEAIEKLGGEQLAGALAHGFLGVIGSAVLGLLIKAGIEVAGDKMAEAVSDLPVHCGRSLE